MAALLGYARATTFGTNGAPLLRVLFPTPFAPFPLTRATPELHPAPRNPITVFRLYQNIISTTDTTTHFCKQVIYVVQYASKFAVCCLHNFEVCCFFYEKRWDGDYDQHSKKILKIITPLIYK